MPNPRASAVAAAIATVFALSTSTAAFAQVAVQRLIPDTTVRGAWYGGQVDISGSQIFVHNKLGAYGERCCKGVVDVYTADGEAWAKTQVLVPPPGLQFRSFAASNQHVVAAGYDVRAYRSVGGYWEQAQVLTAAPAGSWVADLSDELLLLKSAARDSLHVFNWSGVEWKDAGSVELDTGRACASRNDILKVIPTPTNPADSTRDGNGPTSSILTLRHAGDKWVASDTLIVPKDTRQVVCSGDGTTAAVLHGSTVSILDRVDTDSWSVSDLIDLAAHLKYGPMDIEITKDNLYASEEIGVDLPDGRGVYASKMSVWSRRLGSWDHVRTVKPLRPFDPNWEFNDGCLGFSIAANDEYVVAGAPARSLRIDDVEYPDAGEVYVFANALLDNRAAAIPVAPRYELEWSAVYPTPGRGLTHIEYELPEASRVAASVFDVLGREVLLLEDGARDGGPHSHSFDTTRWARGIYFVRLSVNDKTPAISSFVVK